MDSSVGGFILILVFIAILVAVITGINVVFSTKNSDPSSSNNPILESFNQESIYLSDDKAKALLNISDGDLIPLRLVNHEGNLWLQETSTGQLVNVDQRRLPSLGIWAVKVRGTDYYKSGIKKAQLRVGMRVQLLHEPENQYDPNAIAILANEQKIGYYNKGKASRLVKVLSTGQELDSMLISLSPLKVISATDKVFAELLGKGQK